MKDFLDSLIPFLRASYQQDVATMRQVVQQEPRLFEMLLENNRWVVCDAARKSPPEIIRALVELGANVNEQDSNGWTGLCWAVTRDRLDIARTLLELGADPRLHCAIFHVSDAKLQSSVDMASLLLEHGADVNQLFEVEGLPARTALSEAIAIDNPQLVEFLRSRGAKLPSELGRSEAQDKTSSGTEMETAVLSHFTRYFGKPDQKAIRQIVPGSSVPISVHCIPAKQSESGLQVVFTQGLSECELPVPVGAEKYRHAELMIVLPATWPKAEEAIKDPKWAWPYQWMFKIPAYAVNSGTFLGDGLSTLVENLPPQPLGKYTNFKAWMLAALNSAEMVVHVQGGKRIQIYQLFPIYAEEYFLARDKGTEALMNLFVTRRTGEEIVPDRPNVAVS